MATTVYCDRCGKEINHCSLFNMMKCSKVERRKIIDFKGMKMIEDERCKSINYQLCKDCTTSLDQWLKEGYHNAI